MPAEIPIIQPPFSNEPIGIAFASFLQHLYKLPDVLFPLSKKITATFIGFSDERSGEKTLLNWHETGLLNLGGVQYA